MKIRIGILTGGGDCPGLNTVIRAVVKSAAKRGWETLGILGGFEGLLEPTRSRLLDYHDMDGLLFLGGTVLGTSNNGRFSSKAGHGQTRQLDPALLAGARAGFDSLGLHALVVVGGDGSLTIAQQCFEIGLPVVGVPKTIDNDVPGTVITFGFDSAVSFATEALDRLRTTAQSHERVIVCEMMGRYAGWIAAHAGIAGGADVILIPEVPFSLESVCRVVTDRDAQGKKFTVVVAAEGARETGRDFTTLGDSGAIREARLGGIGAVVAEEIGRRTGKETRVCVLGHLQRGGAPTTFDRLLCTRFGAGAVRLIAEKKFGYMVTHRPPDTEAILLSQAIGHLRTVPLDGDIMRTARDLGISFGD